MITAGPSKINEVEHPSEINEVEDPKQVGAELLLLNVTLTSKLSGL
jgi:hypothetical protein